MGITIKDVAHEAGVSRSTVSLVLQRSAKIPTQTQARVRAAMARLGYRPSHMAASLRSSRSYLLGLIVTDLRFPHYAPMAMGIEAAVRQEGYSLLISNSHEDAAQERQNIETLSRYRADGLLITPVQGVSSRDAPALAALRQEGLPFVCLNREVPGLAADYCGSDHAAEMERLVGHLADDLGHARIAMLSGTQLSFPSLVRLAAWREALRRRGLPPDEALVARHAGDRAGGAAGMVDLLARGVPFTAVVCTNDLIAAGALSVLHRAGKRVPEDVSVAGFGGYDDVSPPDKPLTTVAEGYPEIGRRAGELLLRRIRDGTAGSPERIIVPARLRRGATTGPAPDGRGMP